jgi:hypothetical protein
MRSYRYLVDIELRVDEVKLALASDLPCLPLQTYVDPLTPLTAQPRGQEGQLCC